MLLARIREGQTIEAASDGSQLDDGRASAGWLLWAMAEAINNEGQSIRCPTIMLGGTMRVDGRLDANTAFRAEALGCLIISIIFCVAKEFIQLWMMAEAIDDKGQSTRRPTIMLGGIIIIIII